MKKSNEHRTRYKCNESNLFVNELEEYMGGFFADGYYRPGIFVGWTPRPDSVLSRMDTITSRDQLKPIRRGQNLVVNFNY